MARKRDHKAEYAARKKRAKKAGYSGVSEYRRARKVLALPRRKRLPPKQIIRRYDTVTNRQTMDVIELSPGMSRMRREAAKWSALHSRYPRSEFDPGMSNKQVRAYHHAYVERPSGLSRRRTAREKRRRIGAYIADWYDLSEAEWSQRYELIPVS